MVTKNIARTNEITLRPDKNRPALESTLSRQLNRDIIVDSLTAIQDKPWQKNRKPKVILLVPYFTRIKKSLDVIENNLEKNENSLEELVEDKKILAHLRQNDIYELEEMKRAGVPMGLLRIGTAAKKAGYDVQIVDGVYEGWDHEERYFETSEGSTMYQYGLTKKEIAHRIKEFKPDVVGITCPYTHQWGNAREIADLIKSINSNIPIVMGGVHATGLPFDVLLDSPSDFSIARQGDRSFIELLDNITGKPNAKNLEEITGIYYRKDGEIKSTKNAPFLSPYEFNQIAIPDLSLINLSLYNREFHSAGKRNRKEGNLVYIFTSAGCHVGCKFCTIPSMHGPGSNVEQANLEKLLSYLKTKDINEVLIEDDHLLNDPERAREVFRQLKKYDLSWCEEGGMGLFNLIALLPHVKEEYIIQSAASSRIFNKTLEAKSKGLTTEQFIKEMAESGCYGGYLAVESANEDSLSEKNKPTLNASAEYTKEVVKIFKNNGINVTCGLMLGFIQSNGKLYVESRRNIQRTIDYGRELVRVGAAYANPFIVTPLPGAPDFKSLLPYSTRNTDTGYSHEFATMDAPNKAWTRDELDLLRAQSILESRGVQGYKQIVKTGTWPVENS